MAENTSSLKNCVNFHDWCTVSLFALLSHASLRMVHMCRSWSGVSGGVWTGLDSGAARTDLRTEQSLPQGQRIGDYSTHRPARNTCLAHKCLTVRAAERQRKSTGFWLMTCVMRSRLELCTRLGTGAQEFNWKTATESGFGSTITNPVERWPHPRLSLVYWRACCILLHDQTTLIVSAHGKQWHSRQINTIQNK